MNEHVQFVELLSYLRKYMLVIESLQRKNLSEFYVAFVVVRIGLSEPNVLVVDLGTHYLDVLVESFQFCYNSVYAILLVTLASRIVSNLVCDSSLTL